VQLISRALCAFLNSKLKLIQNGHSKHLTHGRLANLDFVSSESDRPILYKTDFRPTAIYQSVTLLLQNRSAMNVVTIK